jgi:hypothetical protein
MEIQAWSFGKTVIEADPEFTEPAVRSAIEQATEDTVGFCIADYADTGLSNISHDRYARVLEGNGAVLWEGWLEGYQETPAQQEASRIAAALNAVNPAQLEQVARWFGQHEQVQGGGKVRADLLSWASLIREAQAVLAGNPLTLQAGL